MLAVLGSARTTQAAGVGTPTGPALTREREHPAAPSRSRCREVPRPLGRRHRRMANMVARLVEDNGQRNLPAGNTDLSSASIALLAKTPHQVTRRRSVTRRDHQLGAATTRAATAGVPLHDGRIPGSSLHTHASAR